MVDFMISKNNELDAVVKKVIPRIRKGERLIDLSREMGFSYVSLYQKLKSSGLPLGTKRRDTRDVEIRLREFIERKGDCWVWVGPERPSFSKEPQLRTMAGCGRWLAGIRDEKGKAANYRKLRVFCGTQDCVNPAHYKLDNRRFDKRNEEIVEKWKKSEECKKHVYTYERLGHEYGLTKQRVEQILKAYGVE